MPTFNFEDPKTGRIYKLEGPAGSTKKEAAAELQRRIDSGEIAQVPIGTEKGRKTNTGSIEYTPPKPPAPQKPSVREQVKDVIKGTVELPVAVATGAVANLAGNLSGAAYEYIANPTRRLLGKAAIADPSEVRASMMNDYTYRPTSESGKASLAALGTLTTPIRIIGEAASDASKKLGGSEFTNAMIGDVAMAVAPGQAIKGVKKVVTIAPEIAKAAAPVKVYDAASNAVYNTQKNTSKYLKGLSSNIPAGRVKNAVTGTQKIVNAVGSDAAAFGTAGGALVSGNVPLAAAVLAARQLRKRGAQNFAKSRNTATGELAATIKQDIASPAVNTYNTEAIGTIGSQNIDDLVNSIKADITITEE